MKCPFYNKLSRFQWGRNSFYSFFFGGYIFHRAPWIRNFCDSKDKPSWGGWQPWTHTAPWKKYVFLWPVSGGVVDDRWPRLCLWKALRVPFFAVTVSDEMKSRRLGSEVPREFGEGWFGKIRRFRYKPSFASGMVGSHRYWVYLSLVDGVKCMLNVDEIFNGLVPEPSLWSGETKLERADVLSIILLGGSDLKLRESSKSLG